MQEHNKYGFWTIPIGKANPDQTPEEGLQQEIQEECNLKILECKELIQRKFIYERNGKMVNVLSHIYEVLKYTGVMKNNEPHKHKKQMFIPLEKIKQLLYLSDATVLYLEHVGYKREAKI